MSLAVHLTLFLLMIETTEGKWLHNIALVVRFVADYQRQTMKAALTATSRPEGGTGEELMIFLYGGVPFYGLYIDPF